MSRKIKRLLGFWEYPGCYHFAARKMVLKFRTGKIKDIHVCEDCAWKLRMKETYFEIR